QTLRWLGVPGDTLFAIGAIGFVLFVFGLGLGYSLEDQRRPSAGARRRLSEHSETETIHEQPQPVSGAPSGGRETRGDERGEHGRDETSAQATPDSDAGAQHAPAGVARGNPATAAPP